MNGQLILREWKEKIEIPLLFLALLAVVVVALLAVPGAGDLRLLLTGSVVLVFLPFLGLMIGASVSVPRSRTAPGRSFFRDPSGSR
jgi:hypothetical protein